MQRFYLVYKSPLGDIKIIYDDYGIVRVILPFEDLEIPDAIYMENDSVKAYFDEYFAGGNPQTPSLNINVTKFQRKVFDALLNTKRGTTITYGALAKVIGCSSPRAVGQALKHNPVPVIVPCHRVVGKGWSGGFAGEISGVKMEFKQFLLDLEK
ncbi:methylated-DNA--[protein]-cysteine S-methyltransferase [Fonticella tunisiensis]|uniref:Methylated-DNA-[protein]-cysteine S-methyltransferase n=1 Tax=Fonticella tunisiensis TaxID=1096341 RepID=A0A4R7KQC8_9CLOT|nr:methylated-DNA--[protein]-cysteine S-methyltransferase [Fonticella tunisiensis]TDT60886.1 methylated-DNA-[protein]-cysteine S-methyltransferase [Fonticella tunisiensis]